MRYSRLISVLLLAPSAALAQKSAQVPRALTLDDAIRIARENNPNFQQTRNLVRNADAAVRTTYGALLPSANANVGTSYTQGGAQYYQGVQLGSSSDTYSSNYRLGINYSLAASALFAPRAARANRAASEANVTNASEALRANITTQYIQALEAAATAALDDTLAQVSQGQVDLANAKMKVGAGTILDVRTAEVGLGQAEVAALQTHNQARIERYKLFQLMGVEPDSSIDLTTTFAVTPPPASADSLIALAFRVNPDLAAKKSTEYATAMQAREARTLYLPSLNFSTGLGGNAFGYANVDKYIEQQQAIAASPQALASCLTTDSVRVGAGLAPRGCSTTIPERAIAQMRANNRPFHFASAPFSIAASISLPVFNNFQREQQIEQAQVARDNAQFDLRARRLQLVTDVTTAYLNVVTAAHTVELQEKTAQQATEALAYAQESYKVGAKTFLDVSVARGQYEQAQVARVNAIYDYHKAFAALENAVGRPLR